LWTFAMTLAWGPIFYLIYLRGLPAKKSEEFLCHKWPRLSRRGGPLRAYGENFVPARGENIGEKSASRRSTHLFAKVHVAIRSARPR
jgi:hypothetical protein